MYHILQFNGLDRATERGGEFGAFFPRPHSAYKNYGPKSIYSNRTVKYSIKAVTKYILPWAPQALSAALGLDNGKLANRYAIICQ